MCESLDGAQRPPLRQEERGGGVNFEAVLERPRSSGRVEGEAAEGAGREGEAGGVARRALGS